LFGKFSKAKNNNRGLKMISHYCTGRSRPGRSRLGRVYHGSRVRGGHNSNSLIVLIDAVFASEMLGVATTLLETAARRGLIPHYRIGDQISFDPVEVDRWARRHRVDELGPAREVE
jgi:hypothetical protein